MLRKIIIFLAVFVVGMIATDDDIFNSAFFEKSNKNSKDDLSIISVDDTNDVIPHRPVHYNNLEMVKRVDGVVQYNIGARTRSDRLVASGGQNQSWPQPHNVQIQLTYPTQGYGAQVTYVSILVNQTSSLGQAYIVKGGINQHMISVIVEAYNTNLFNVYAYVYGL